MKPRFPLYAKILLWFFLNLVVLGGIIYALFRLQFGVGPELLLSGRAGERLQVVARLIAEELNSRPRSQWNETLTRFSEAYQIQFLVFRNEGAQLAGEAVTLPPAVFQRITGRPLPRRGQPPGPIAPEVESAPDATRSREPRSGRSVTTSLRPPFIVRTDNPPRYWLGVRLPVTDRIGERTARSVTLLGISESIAAGGLLVDFTPWIWLSAGAVLFSVLFWLPLVRGITRSAEQMTQATVQIASGKFDIRLEEHRKDELGLLGQAINRMAVRLSGLVTGQKRFLGDIAHELSSPIARLQMAVGILEDRLGPPHRQQVNDLREEVEHISGLVNELLTFSKAALSPARVQLKPVRLRSVIQTAVTRESRGEARIEIDVPENAAPVADPELLLRAMANLIRNAIRYAGSAGAIAIAARAQTDGVEVVVADRGPGVPEEELARIFDPFYRVDVSRARETGGVGLGLSIVKTCIESCGGTVTCRNRQPSGLEVIIRLPQRVLSSGLADSTSGSGALGHSN